MDWILQPWPWYIVGPLIGLTVPLLLLLGNKSFGISSSLRHICAACIPTKSPFFNYDWKKESWNLFFVFGVFVGGLLTSLFLSNNEPIIIHKDLIEELSQYGITDFSTLVPKQLFNWGTLASLQGFVFIILGGFFVGFGTRYGGGCTSGHAILGLSSLQWPSLIATICFMAGGFLVANFIIPILF
ncbi:MAG: YeeE/YedE family protein [Bacteroidia bacterium]